MKSAKKKSSNTSEALRNAIDAKQRFAGEGCPSKWLHCAEELQDSAEKLWQASSDTMEIEMLGNDEGQRIARSIRIDVSNSYLLLAGYHRRTPGANGTARCAVQAPDGTRSTCLLRAVILTDGTASFWNGIL